VKIGFSVTTHNSSEFRPEGFEYLDRYLESLFTYCRIPIKVFIVDNQSDETYNIPLRNKDISYTYIENQFKTGITGAWNLGIKQAIDNNCDIILNTNDDIIFNESINDFIDFIDQHQYKNISIYGPLADNLLPSPQKSLTVQSDSVLELDGTSYGSVLSGFCLGFTKEFYNHFKYNDGDLFTIQHKYNEGDGKWGGQEGEMIKWKQNGAKLFVVGNCWLRHMKNGRKWSKTRDKDKKNGKN